MTASGCLKKLTSTHTHKNERGRIVKVVGEWISAVQEIEGNLIGG